MSDLIDRQAAINALMKRDKELRNINWYDKPYAEGECRGIDEALAIVSNLPSVQPQPRTGKWIVHLYKFGEGRYECDNCHGRCDREYKFCPNCGADMRGDNDEPL